MNTTDDPRQSLDKYLDNLQFQRMLSAHTIASYRRDLAELAQMAGEIPWVDVDQGHIRKFAAQLHARGLNPRSIARKLSSWRGFFDWLAQASPLKRNPAEGVRPPRKNKPLPKALSVDDAVHLVSQDNPARGQSGMQACNRAMFELLYSCGLRVSELCGLDVTFVREEGYTSTGWLDIDNQEVFVTGKGNKMRSVPVGSHAIAALSEWIEVRATMPRKTVDTQHMHALFLSERGSRISPRVAQLRLKEHGKALGLATDVHPHMLRHSFASHMLQGSGDLRAVQELLGHASIAATQVYTSLDFQRLAQVYDAAHPRAKKPSPR